MSIKSRWFYWLRGISGTMLMLCVASGVFAQNAPKTFFLEFENGNQEKQRIEVSADLEMKHVQSDTDGTVLVVKCVDGEYQFPLKDLRVTQGYEEDDLTGTSLISPDEILVKIQDGSVLIENPGLVKVNAQVVDLSGRVLYNQSTQEPTISIALVDFPKGVIVISINGQSYKYISK